MRTGKGPLFWDKEKLAWVQDNITRLRTKDMADHFGVNVAAMRKQITTWRRQGNEIPFGKVPWPIGTVVERNTPAGQLAKYVKTERGWRRYQKEQIAVAARPKVVEVKPAKVTKPSGRPAKRMVKPRPNKLETRILDLSSRERVWIPELKMNVWVEPGKTIAEVRAKYFAQRGFMNKAYAS